MKQFVCVIIVSWLSVSTKAQTSLCITTGKTTSLVFAYNIRHVDRGTKSILAEQVKEAPNVLLIKAATRDFSPTNLSVITDDGNVYSFNIIYEENPSTWVYPIPTIGDASVATYANAILDNRRSMHGINNQHSGVRADVTGIYTKGNVMYFQLMLFNQSSIDYDIDLFRFYTKDKKKSKRTAVQENDLQPIYIAGNKSKVKASDTSVLVIALDKFTIPDAKYLAIEVMEKDGGRHLFLKVSNRKIMHATPLPGIR